MAYTPKDEDLPVDLAVDNDASLDAKVHWFRGTTCQSIIVGMASFLAPGVYSAMAATGAGGLANVTIGNASVAVAYALIVPSALMATGVMSKLGPTWALAIGACGYAPYAAALYANSAFANQWGLVVGAIVCGLTSGIFWVTEGAVIMNYSEPARKGKLLANWQSLYLAANLIGGGINLGLNIHLDKKGGLSPKTYLVFVSLQCVAPFVALLLSPPSKVQRKDAKPVPEFPNEGFFTEIWLTIKELADPRVLACTILWSQCLFAPSFVSTYLARHFSVRARGLASLIEPVLCIIAFQTSGRVLDSKNIAVRKKTVGVWAVSQLVSVVTIVWLLIQVHFLETSDEDITYDWTTKNFAKMWVPAIFCYATQWFSYGFNYYMAGYVFPQQADGKRMSRIIATLRSAESGSAAIAYGINATGTTLTVTGGINVAFIFTSLFAGAYVVNYIWKEDKKGAFSKKFAYDGEEVAEK
ncbi:hypothetical protein MNV49_005663 [Pseudohyphozyma bogoriensis]|nr:hypothetical protein MNV49_005663 [Pseudohyphozyma bogoriensis]